MNRNAEKTTIRLKPKGYRRALKPSSAGRKNAPRAGGRKKATYNGLPVEHAGTGHGTAGDEVRRKLRARLRR